MLKKNGAKNDEKDNLSVERKARSRAEYASTIIFSASFSPSNRAASSICMMKHVNIRGGKFNVNHAHLTLGT